MNAVKIMNGAETFKNRFDYVCTLIKLEDGVLAGSLIGIEVSFIAKLHNNENPSLIWV